MNLYSIFMVHFREKSNKINIRNAFLKCIALFLDFLLKVYSKNLIIIHKLQLYVKKSLNIFLIVAANLRNNDF